jgi:hypothetical protein
MKVQRTISLDERTASIAGSMNNLSEFVRARLLAHDEEVIDDFAEVLANLSSRRLLAICHARLGELARRGDHADLALDAQAALYALSEVLRDA